VLDNIRAREYHVLPEQKLGIVVTVDSKTLYLLALQTEVSKTSARKAKQSKKKKKKKKKVFRYWYT